MDDYLAEAVRLQGLPAAIGADLSVAGGILRCTGCGSEQPLGDVASRLSHGWPKCCGQTMTWVTAKMLAYESRMPVPEGYHLEAVPSDSLSTGTWRIDPSRRCRHGRKACGKPSVIAILRGTVRQVWWGYCESHAFGRWIEHGQVMCWVLKADSDG